MSQERDLIFVVEITAWDSGASAEIVLRYATQGFSTTPSDTPASTYFDERVKQAGALKRDLFDSGTTYGESRTGIGDVILDNTDGVLDGLIDYAFDGRSFVEKWGYKGSAYSTFQTLFKTTMHEVLIDREVITVKLRDRQTEMQVPFQTTKYAGTNVLPAGLEGEADLTGKPKPELIGNALGIPAVLVNRTKLIYQVSNSALSAIDAVYDNGVRVGNGILSWGSRTSQFGATTIRALAYGNGVWVAVGDAGKLSTSTDNGATWTAQTSGFGASNIMGVAYGVSAGNVPTFVAVGDGGKIYRSTNNGVTWVAATTPSFGATNLRAITTGDSGKIWVAVGEGGKVANSGDGGDTWTQRTTGYGATVVCTATAYGNGLFVVTTDFHGGTLLTSPDGATWTSRTHAFGAVSVNSVAYGNGVWVLFCDSNYVQTSTDAIVWTSRGQVLAFAAGNNLVSVTFGNGTFIGGDDAEGATASSTDGVVWTKVRAGNGASGAKAAGYGNNVFIVAGAPGALYTSATVVTYASQADLLDDTLAPIAGSYGVYLAGGMFRLGLSATGQITTDARSANNTPALAYTYLMTRRGFVAGTDFLAADASALPAYTVGRWVGEEVTYATLLDELAATVGSWWGVSQADVYRTVVITSPSTGTSTLTVTNEDMVKPFQRVSLNDDGGGIPSYNTILQYARNFSVQTTLAPLATLDQRQFATQEWRTVSSLDASIKTAHPLAQQLTISTWIQSVADATTEVARRQTLRATQRSRGQFAVKLSPDLSNIGLGDNTFALDYGAIITVTHPRYGLSAGRKFLVIGVEPDYQARELSIGVWG